MVLELVLLDSTDFYGGRLWFMLIERKGKLACRLAVLFHHNVDGLGLHSLKREPVLLA
jgi:hypothetical protein